MEKEEITFGFDSDSEQKTLVNFLKCKNLFWKNKKSLKIQNLIKFNPILHHNDEKLNLKLML